LSAEHPSRVTGLILVDAAVYEGTGAPAWLFPLFKTPQGEHMGPLLARSLAARGEEILSLAWHDPSLAPSDIRQGYQNPFQVTNWVLALWELTKATRPTGLADQLHTISVPALGVTGDDDRIVSPELSRQLAQDIPGATFQMFPQCGHLPPGRMPFPFPESCANIYGRSSLVVFCCATNSASRYRTMRLCGTPASQRAL